MALRAQTAGIAGVSVNSVNGQPLAGVHLRLVVPNIANESPDVYGAMSGRDGRFSITAIPPGTYAFFAERTGFVHMMAAAGTIPVPSITLKAGEPIADYKLEMTPRAVISGRVVDDYGDPVPDVRVEVTPVSPDAPRAASLSDSARWGSTNTRGEFRITGGPGKFYIKATPAGPNQLQEIRTDGTSDAPYGPTWFPSAAGADRATPVEVGPGADIAIEIRLAGLRTLSITGTVTGIPQDGSAIVEAASGGLSRRILAGPDGRFSFSRLGRGMYRVWAVAAGDLRSQIVEVKPEGPDTVDVQLTLATGPEIAGTVAIAGDPPEKSQEKRTVTLGSLAATTQPDGTFKLAGVLPDRYRVNVQPLPDNGYIKTVELDGVVAAEQEIDFTRAVHGSRLKITLGRDGAQLSGTVREKDGRALGNTLALVILASAGSHISAASGGGVDQMGKYSIKGIRPGKYLLLAVDALRSGPFHSEDDLNKLAPFAEEIEIKAGEKIAKDLKVILKEDVDARSQK